MLLFRIVMVILALFIPPLAVYFICKQHYKYPRLSDYSGQPIDDDWTIVFIIIACILTLLLWVPGVVYAWFLIATIDLPS